MSYYLVTLHNRRSIGPFTTKKELLAHLEDNTGYKEVPQALKAMGVELTETVNLAEWGKKDAARNRP